MDDLISRQAAIKAIDDLPNCYNGYSDTYDKAYIIGVIEELPTIELPDHGDLIDRDELMKHCVYMPRDGGNLPVVYMSYVKAAKTVIPAERSEVLKC